MVNSLDFFLHKTTYSAPVLGINIPPTPNDISFFIEIASANPALASTLRDFLAGEKVEIKTGVEVITTLLRRVTEHRYFDMWCTTSRAAEISNETREYFGEIEIVTDAARQCFSWLVSGFGDEAYADIVDLFQERGIDMVDTAQAPPLLKGMHYIQVKLDNSAGYLFIHNSNTTIGR